MITLDAALRDRCVEKLPEVVKKFMEKLEICSVVAGGFIRDVVVGREPKDVDVYVRNEQFLQAVAEFDKVGLNAQNLMYSTKRKLIKYREIKGCGYGIDLIGVEPVLEDVAERFDFTVNCAMLKKRLSGGYTLTGHERFIEDNYGKILMPMKQMNFTKPVERIVKMVKKGYAPSREALAVVSMACTLDVLEKAGCGVNPGFLWKGVEALYGVKIKREESEGRGGDVVGEEEDDEAEAALEVPELVVTDEAAEYEERVRRVQHAELVALQQEALQGQVAAQEIANRDQREIEARYQADHARMQERAEMQIRYAPLHNFWQDLANGPITNMFTTTVTTTPTTDTWRVLPTIFDLPEEPF